MLRHLSPETIYLLNLSLLITHEIDSAFWKEWELFGLPGGIQLFLILNFVLVIVFIYGLPYVVRQQPQGNIFSWLLIAAGFIAVVLHGFFLVSGYQQFNEPVSLAVLAAIWMVSTIQLIMMIGDVRAKAS